MTIFNPDDSEVTEIVLPDGSQAGEVVAPDGSVVWSAAADIPDSVVSRPDDDGTASRTGSAGLKIKPKSDFGKIGARISLNTSGVSRARLFDYQTGQYEITKGISGLSSGDTFQFSYDFVADSEYGIELDDDANGYTEGYSSDGGLPYSGEEIDIVERSNGGSVESDTNPLMINDIGNPDGILD